ncbi:MAG: MDR/zinc-dependent alcohol dehydrogenase-like family protein [Vicinamibacteraceae bacterium]
MKALVISLDGQVDLRDVRVPSRAGECLVRVTLAGICGTDLHMMRGYAAHAGILGHEFVGVVEETPPEQAAWRGRRVVGEINVGCGHCAWCDASQKEHCQERTVLGIKQRDGAFAELLTLPAANLHEVPSAVNDEAAVFTEPVAAACRILEQVPIGPDTRVAVIGDGRMGLLTAQVLHSTGAQPLVIGRHAEKLAVARQLGLNAMEYTAGVSSSYDVVVDVSGGAAGLRLSLDLVRPRGTVVLKSTFHGATPVETWPIVVDEVSLVGSRCGPFAPALDLLARGVVQTASLVAGDYPLSEYRGAFEAAKTSLKVLLRM